jgi:hypothetical protein
MGRTVVRWNKGNVESALGAAAKLAAEWGSDRYVFATAYGYQIGAEPPPFWHDYIRLAPTGAVTEHTFEPVTREWTVVERGTWKE